MLEFQSPVPPAPEPTPRPHTAIPSMHRWMKMAGPRGNNFFVEMFPNFGFFFPENVKQNCNEMAIYLNIDGQNTELLYIN